VENNFRPAATNLEIQCSALQCRRDALLFAALGLSLALFSRGLWLATPYLTRHVADIIFHGKRHRPRRENIAPPA